MKNFAVILSGCGVYDGSEIHEAVLTLLAIDRNHATYTIFAPDTAQMHVINHATGQEMPEQRNVLVESARIARGKISPLSQFKADDFDALVFPGGFGAAKNLSNYATKGADMTVHPEVEYVIRAMYAAHKPIGALCISPILLAKILGNVKITLGAESSDSESARKLGAHYTATTHGEVVVDSTNQVYSTPCYMLDASISQIADGADKLIKAML